jgi:hypothetical protein
VLFLRHQHYGSLKHCKLVWVVSCWCEHIFRSVGHCGIARSPVAHAHAETTALCPPACTLLCCWPAPAPFARPLRHCPLAVARALQQTSALLRPHAPLQLGNSSAIRSSALCNLPPTLAARPSRLHRRHGRASGIRGVVVRYGFVEWRGRDCSRAQRGACSKMMV